MKKLLQATIVLLLFCASLVIIQTSCTKSIGQTNTSAPSALNKFIFISLGTSGETQIWISDYNGNNAFQIPIAMPAGSKLSTDFGSMDVKLSPDGQQIFFMGVLTDTNKRQIYSCGIDGQNVKVIVPNPDGTDYLKIGGAY